jgi:ribosomal protein S18 acetylase RimI-like enzyme
MTTDERLLLADLNYAEAMRELTRRAGGVVLDEDGLLLFASPHPLPVLANGVMRTGDVPPEAVLARARAFFDARARGFSVFVRAHADADLRAACEAERLHLNGESPGMVVDGRLPEGPGPGAGVTVEEVASAAGVRDFAQVMAEAYATYGMPPDVAPAVLPHLGVLRAPHIGSVLVRSDGVPAAGAMVIVTHGVAGVYWVGTVPAARGRGLAELATRRATNLGFDRGARLGALQASVMGEPVYRRMGWVEITRYPLFVQWSAGAVTRTDSRG